MATRDTFHQHVREALEKDGWTITDDPLLVKLAGIESQIDLGAERIIGAEKGTEKIAVEIKTFGNISFVTAFYAALGQFIAYRNTLSVKQPERILYLAVPLTTYLSNFGEPLVQLIIKNEQLKVIVYNPHKKLITKWIK